MRAFSVDRLRNLDVGRVLELVQYGDVHPAALQSHVDELFPHGVTQHGDRYFLNGQQQARLADPSMELIWEYVRRARFPARPSRFQSAFGCETLDEAKAFRASYGQEDDPIWEVECDDVFKADMHLLTQGENSILVMSYLAERYWASDSGVRFQASWQPVWELLLVPPVTVIARAG